MKKLLSIFAMIAILASCTKEDDGCKTCKVIIETNAQEAQHRCNGLANNYPQGFVITNQYDKVYCGLLPSNHETQTQICSGVFATVRTRYNCN